MRSISTTLRGASPAKTRASKAFLCSCTPSSTFYKLLEIERPVLPYGEVGEPQSGEGARSNTPPTACCFESYARNTGEPERDMKEGGEEEWGDPDKTPRPYRQSNWA